MASLSDQVREPLIATNEEAQIAREAAAKLKPLADAQADVEVRVVEHGEIVVALPARAVRLITEFLTAIAERRPVSLIPYTAELTTQQAAEFLNVSRPYVVGLIDKDEIPHRMVGTHRRVLLSDLIAYKKKSDARRQEAIGKMVAEAQKLRLP
jgi:excisionase family DNA binding protein